MRTLNQACKTYKFICTCTCAYTVKLVEVSRFMKLEKRDKLSKEVLVSIPHCLGYAIEHWNSYMWLHRTRFSVRRHQLLSLAAQRGRGGGWDEVSPLSGPATPAWATCLKFIQYFLFSRDRVERSYQRQRWDPQLCRLTNTTRVSNRGEYLASRVLHIVQLASPNDTPFSGLLSAAAFFYSASLCCDLTHIAVMTFSMMATSDTTISLSDTFRSRPFAHAQFALHFRWLHHHCAILCAWVEYWLQTGTCIHKVCTSCTQYSTEIQEFGDGSNRHGVRLTLLKPQLQDSGHYICTAENKFETQTETVQLSVWLPGVHNIQFRVNAFQSHEHNYFNNDFS